MPQAPAKVTARVRALFPDADMLDVVAIQFLSDAGFRSIDFVWQLHRELTDEEQACLDYLCMEWDWGWEREEGAP